MARIGTDLSYYVFQSSSETSATTGSYTTPTGDRRKVLIGISMNGVSSEIGAPTSVTLGGVNATAVSGAAAQVTNSFDVRSEIWYIDETNIPAGSNTCTISGLTAATTREIWIYIATVDDISQTARDAADADSNTSGTTISSTLSPDANAQIFSVYVSNMSGTSSYTLTAGGETELLDDDQNATAGAAYKSCAGTETTFTTTGASSWNRAVRVAAWWVEDTGVIALGTRAAATTANNQTLTLNVDPGTRAAATTASNPTLGLDISLGTIAAATTASNPTLALNVDLGTVASATTAYDPTVALASTISLDTLAAATTASNPTLGLDVSLGTIAAATSANNPTLGLTLDLSTRASATAANNPTLTLAIDPGTIAAATVANDPLLTLAILLGTRASATAANDPTLALDIALGTIASATTAYNPTLTTVAVISLDWLDASAVLYDVTVVNVVTAPVRLGAPEMIAAYSLGMPEVIAAYSLGDPEFTAAYQLGEPELT